MNLFFLEFRDPLFSVIIFFALIFIITFLSYWWGRYRRKEDYKHLDEFLKQFRKPPAKDELSVAVSNGAIPQKIWLLLASSYSKNGDYEKSIEIYNGILKQSDNQDQKEIMFLLGKTYFKAGFLERSKQIYLEILKKHPRTPQVLESLLLVYEYTKDYESAMDVLEPLEELKQDISGSKIYLRTLTLLNNQAMVPKEKTQQLIEIYKESHQLSYMIFEYIFRFEPALAWNNFDSSKSQKMTDILWNVKKEDLNLEIIAQNSYLRELYTARGDVEFSQRSEVFEFDTLINLENKASATLSFEYICDNCKQISPFSFYRCTNCHSIDTIGIEVSLTKDYRKDFSEENNSFQ